MAAVTTNLSNLGGHHFQQRLEAEGSMDSNDVSNYGRESPLVDNNSCCSDDTVLSVGKETPPPSQTLSFKNIESHLNAISQLTNSTLGDERFKPAFPTSTPTSPLSSHRLSPMSTKSIPSPTPYAYKSDVSEAKSSPTTSPSFVNPLFRPTLTSSPEASPKSTQSPKPNDLFFRQTKQNDNEPSNPSLKFSIDNILKADFGRRITDPINIKKAKPKKATLEEPPKNAPVDLSKESEKPSGQGDSAQPMLWPAWVYCTRYSDRPSSGKCLLVI